MSLAVEVKVFTEQSGMIHHPNESSLCCYVLYLYEKVLDYFLETDAQFSHNFSNVPRNCVIFLYSSVLTFLI